MLQVGVRQFLGIGHRLLQHSGVSVLQPYPGMPYYKGCVFSNGPVYIDIAAGLLNVSLEDNAVGGATSGAALGSLGIPVGFANRTAPTTVDVPSTLEQVKQNRILNTCADGLWLGLVIGSSGCALLQVSRDVKSLL